MPPIKLRLPTRARAAWLRAVGARPKDAPRPRRRDGICAAAPAPDKRKPKRRRKPVSLFPHPNLPPDPLPKTGGRATPAAQARSVRLGRMTEDVAARGDGSVQLEYWPAGCKRVPGGDDGPRIVPVKTPCDFVGTCREQFPGRAIWFDAKHTSDPYSFPIGDPEIVRVHQVMALVRHGQAGAIAGLLIERKHLADYAWVDWRVLVPYQFTGGGADRPSTFQWADPVWFVLGPNMRTIPFRRLLVAYAAGVVPTRPCPARRARAGARA